VSIILSWHLFVIIIIFILLNYPYQKNKFKSLIYLKQYYFLDNWIYYAICEHWNAIECKHVLGSHTIIGIKIYLQTSKKVLTRIFYVQLYNASRIYCCQ